MFWIFDSVMWQHVTALFVVIHSILRLDCTADESMIQVQDSGLLPLTPRDVALRMYLDIRNRVMKMVFVSVKSNRCCLVFKHGEEDCKVMELFGMYKGELESLKQKRIQFAYPTVYPYDLEGQCEIHIEAEKKHALSVTIPFNTILQHDPLVYWLPYILQEVLFGISISACNGRDQDSLQYCQPVNCVLKYQGQRSYYNHTIGQCEEVPICKDKTPIYDPISNLCKKKEVGLETLPSTDSETTPQIEKDVETYLKVICVHGEMSGDKRSCKCYYGWKSMHLSSDQLSPYDPVYRMCDVSIFVEKWLPVVFICSALLVALFVGLIVWIWLKPKNEPQRKKESLPVRKKGSSFMDRLYKYSTSCQDIYMQRELPVGSVKVALFKSKEFASSPTLNVRH